jgi:hypothetical protein
MNATIEEKKKNNVDEANSFGYQAPAMHLKPLVFVEFRNAQD